MFLFQEIEQRRKTTPCHLSSHLFPLLYNPASKENWFKISEEHLYQRFEHLFNIVVPNLLVKIPFVLLSERL